MAERGPAGFPSIEETPGFATAASVSPRRSNISTAPTDPTARSLPIIGFGELAVLVCWVVVLGVVELVGACGVGVLGRLMAVAGLVGGGVPVLGF